MTRRQIASSITTSVDVRPVVEPAAVRDQWAFWLGLLAALLVLTLVGCSAGTRLTTSGTICGQPFELAMADRKDRSGFAAEVTCSDGSSVMISSSKSSTSAVIAAQAELATRLTALAEILARSLPMPPVSADGRGLELEQLAYTIEAEDMP